MNRELAGNTQISRWNKTVLYSRSSKSSPRIGKLKLRSTGPTYIHLWCKRLPPNWPSAFTVKGNSPFRRTRWTEIPVPIILLFPLIQVSQDTTILFCLYIHWFSTSLSLFRNPKCNMQNCHHCHPSLFSSSPSPGMMFRIVVLKHEVPRCAWSVAPRSLHH